LEAVHICQLSLRAFVITLHATRTATSSETETGSAPGASYTFVWDTSATSTDTASNDPASLKTTVGHTQSYDGSLHAVGDDGPSAWYTLDKTDARSSDWSRVNDPFSGRYTASGGGGETSTAVESAQHGDATASFTEVLSHSGTYAGAGDGAAGYDTFTASGSRGASFNQYGSDAAGTFSVAESSSGSYANATQSAAGVAETTITETATTTDTATQSSSGPDPFTLSASGLDSSTATAVANAVTGATARAESGTDVYTLSETGAGSGGSFTQTVTGTDSYAGSFAGNQAAQAESGTTTGGGTWTRTASGPGSTLPSGNGTNSYTLTTTGNAVAGVFSHTATGSDRYDLVQRFEDVSNAAGGASPGHVTFNSHGLPFRDPPPQGWGPQTAVGQNRTALSTQYQNYYRSLGQLQELKSHSLYGNDAKYTALVDEFAMLVGAMAPPEVPEELYRGSKQKGVYPPDWVPFDKSDRLPKAMDPETQREAGLALGRLYQQADKYRRHVNTPFLERYLEGIGRAFLGTGEAILNIDKVPGALRLLLTSPEARAALVADIEDKLGRIVEGDAGALGELTFEIPMAVATGGGTLTAVKTGGKIIVKISKETLLKLRGLKGKALLDELVKATEEAVKKSDAHRTGRLPDGMDTPRGPRRLSADELEDLHGHRFAELNDLAARVMNRLGVPRELRGIEEQGRHATNRTGQPFTFETAQGGRNTKPGRNEKLEAGGHLRVTRRGINVDAAVLDDNFLPFASWRNATIEQRMEAIVAHELAEYASTSRHFSWRHADAMMRSYRNPHISEQARAIIADQIRNALGGYDGQITDALLPRIRQALESSAQRNGIPR
jgi:hypothetical protein